MKKCIWAKNLVKPENVDVPRRMQRLESPQRFASVLGHLQDGITSGLRVVF